MRFLPVTLAALALAGCGKGEFEAMDALALCDNAIKSTSINPKSVEIPHRSGALSDGQFVFAWDKGGEGVLMPNQYGAKFEVSAVCRVDTDSERVVHLEIDGRALSPK